MTLPIPRADSSASETSTPSPNDPANPAPTVNAEPGPPATIDSTPAIPPELIDHPRYRILEVIGQGGMGVVYKAEDQRLGRVVALKVIQESLTANEVALQRFEQEVKAAAKLSHPNIVTAYDADHVGSLRFLVMEYVEGQSLADYVRQRGRLSVTEACDCIRQAALGLQHAYERGMIHRDIKPHNLMRTPQGTIKILDFGLARFVRGQQQGVSQLTQLTQQGVMMGTVDYMAPEQASDSRTADIRSDIYSLGCTLYQLLTGNVPFPGGSPIDKVVKHAVERPAPILELRPDVPPALGRTIQRMMAKEPSARFQTPAEVVSILGLFLDSDAEEPLAAVPVLLSPAPPPPTLTAFPPLSLPTAPALSAEERDKVLRRLRGSVSGLRFASFLYGVVTFFCACGLLYMTILWLASPGWTANPSEVQGMYTSRNYFSPYFWQVFLLGLITMIFMTMTALLSFGASQMRLGQGYTWVMAAIISALLPLTPLIVITGPIGLGALARLHEPEVKAAFGRPSG